MLGEADFGLCCPFWFMDILESVAIYIYIYWHIKIPIEKLRYGASGLEIFTGDNVYFAAFSLIF